MIFFVTYNDQPSGVFWSQVTDVVDHMNTLGGDRVRLVALVSMRGYMTWRKRIRTRVPDAIVLPMVPRQHNWSANWFWLWLLCRRFRPTGMIGRGIFATALALRMRDKGLVRQVCFDGRAAYGADRERCGVVGGRQSYRTCRTDARLKIVGQQRRIELSVDSFSMLPLVVIGTRRIATLHRKLAENFSRHLPVRVVEAPFDMPPVIETMAWPIHLDHDLAHQWLRTQIAASILPVNASAGSAVGDKA